VTARIGPFLNVPVNKFRAFFSECLWLIYLTKWFSLWTLLSFTYDATWTAIKIIEQEVEPLERQLTEH